jgi:hypothetical protein
VKRHRKCSNRTNLAKLDAHESKMAECCVIVMIGVGGGGGGGEMNMGH